jgi:hypothetical protein
VLEHVRGELRSRVGSDVTVERDPVLLVLDRVTRATDLYYGEYLFIPGKVQKSREKVGWQQVLQIVRCKAVLQDRRRTFGVDLFAELLVLGFGADGVCLAGSVTANAKG